MKTKEKPLFQNVRFLKEELLIDAT